MGRSPTGLLSLQDYKLLPNNSPNCLQGIIEESSNCEGEAQCTESQFLTWGGRRKQAFIITKCRPNRWTVTVYFEAPRGVGSEGSYRQQIGAGRYIQGRFLIGQQCSDLQRMCDSHVCHNPSGDYMTLHFDQGFPQMKPHIQLTIRVLIYWKSKRLLRITVLSK